MMINNLLNLFFYYFKIIYIHNKFNINLFFRALLIIFKFI